jgi:oligoribonuclease NrnB/cAMP/cGMP phosphodiesterase (DHH superfamily)
VRRKCFYHAGCPDGFGAAYSVWRAWGEDAHYIARGHEDVFEPAAHEGDQVVFVDIALRNDLLCDLAESAAEVILLDHHVTARDHYAADPSVENRVTGAGHRVHFDLAHSGAILAWQYFHREPPPLLLAYVEDQDLWNWKLPRSEAVNAAIGSYPREFEVWDALARRPWQELAEEGEPILRAQRVDVERSLHLGHPIALGSRRVEAVNGVHLRSHIGHELAKRAAFGHAIGVVYRLAGRRVDCSIYSIGDVDVSEIARGYGGGGHRNASGFSVTLEEWLKEMV